MTFEAGALISAIVFLFGVVSTLAKVAWTERGMRLNKAEAEVNFYKNEIIPSTKRLADAGERHQLGLEALTKVIERELERDR